jgi:hypothetical protein
MTAILRMADPDLYELDHTLHDTLKTTSQNVLECSDDVTETYVRAIDAESESSYGW